MRDGAFFTVHVHVLPPELLVLGPAVRLVGAVGRVAEGPLHDADGHLMGDQVGARDGRRQLILHFLFRRYHKTHAANMLTAETGAREGSVLAPSSRKSNWTASEWAAYLLHAPQIASGGKPLSISQIPEKRTAALLPRRLLHLFIYLF